MTKLVNQFRHVSRTSAIVTDERGLSTVEYVIILVLIAAAAVGAWVKLGGSITSKINSSQGEIDSNVTFTPSGNKSPN